MKEPNWSELEARLKQLTVRQLRRIGSHWFNGMLGGASSKGDIICEMVSQMRSFWRNKEGGRERVANVIREISSIDGGSVLSGQVSYRTVDFGGRKDG